MAFPDPKTFPILGGKGGLVQLVSYELQERPNRLFRSLSTRLYNWLTWHAKEKGFIGQHEKINSLDDFGKVSSQFT
jgi:hypothetical protein